MKETTVNEFRCQFPALSANESLARSLAAAFVSQASPTVSQLADIKCAVSEAVTNAVVHAYPDRRGKVELRMKLTSVGRITITVRDSGIGIADVSAAREPLFTTDHTGERSGMGFAIMESLMDAVRVRSVPGKGTSVTLTMKVGLFT